MTNDSKEDMHQIPLRSLTSFILQQIQEYFLFLQVVIYRQMFVVVGGGGRKRGWVRGGKRGLGGEMEDNLIGLSREDYFDIHKNPPTCLYLPVTSVCKHVARFFQMLINSFINCLAFRYTEYVIFFYKLPGSWICFVIYS